MNNINSELYIFCNSKRHVNMNRRTYLYDIALRNEVAINIIPQFQYDYYNLLYGYSHINISGKYFKRASYHSTNDKLES